MATWLKQSTAVNIPLGPFLDDVDGKTAETGLTISQADVRLKKNDGNWAQKNDSNAATHEENGWYEIALDTTDTNTPGILVIAVHESGALPVWREFLVVPADVYNGVISGNATLPAQGAPPATGSFVGFLSYLYKSWRNKIETTATETKFYDDAGTTVDHKHSNAESSGTFTKGEVATGP